MKKIIFTLVIMAMLIKGGEALAGSRCKAGLGTTQLGEAIALDCVRKDWSITALTTNRKKGNVTMPVYTAPEGLWGENNVTYTGTEEQSFSQVTINKKIFRGLSAGAGIALLPSTSTLVGTSTITYSNGDQQDWSLQFYFEVQ